MHQVFFVFNTFAGIKGLTLSHGEKERHGAGYLLHELWEEGGEVCLKVWISAF
jgi:hypothetical protein